ncbi:hypothetical protein PHMEG_00026512, partial [Phytophthora megakarya]
NKRRVYLKDKPHKWETNLFMLCNAVTVYCIGYVACLCKLLCWVMLCILTSTCDMYRISAILKSLW